jgi:nicotinate-nucleotide adenylyltransferase
LVRLATEGNAAFQVSDVEYHLPKPSYTIDTLTYLQEKHKNRSFSVIMGSDSFGNIGKWKNGTKLASEYDIIVYERPGFEIHGMSADNVQVLQAPLLDISATQIRTLIKEGKSIKYMVRDRVMEEIENNRYYK